MTTRHNLPEPEDVVLSKDYCFTVSPSDKHQSYKYNSKTRVTEFMKQWNEIFNKYFKSITTIRVKLRMEVSKHGRLHFHGWIRFRTEDDIRIFYVYIFPHLKDNCTFDIHEFKDKKSNGDEFVGKYKTWIDYVNKQNLYNEWIKVHIKTITDSV